jgi:hypothetical protein
VPLKPLAQLTLRELLDQVGAEKLQAAGQLLSAVQATYGLPVLFTLTPSVSLTDRLRDSAVAGRGFASFWNRTGVAAQNSHLQLWNPGTSGVRAIVRGLFAEPVGGASAVIIADHNAALSVLVGPGSRRRLGGPDSALELRVQNNATLIGTNLVTILDTARADVQPLLEEAYYVVPPGRGLILSLLTQALGIDGYMTWDEEPV